MGGGMNHEPPAELSAEQIRGVLELRAITVAEDDLAALPGLAAALRQQANGLRDALSPDGRRAQTEGP
jgi:hypothetical protein